MSGSKDLIQLLEDANSTQSSEFPRVSQGTAGIAKILSANQTINYLKYQKYFLKLPAQQIGFSGKKLYLFDLVT